MNCHEVRHHAMTYLDGEADAELRLRIDEHFEGCSACGAWFARQERLERMIRDRLSVGRATSEMWDRIHTGAGVQAPRRRRRSRRLVLGGSLCTAAVLLLAVVLAGHWNGHPQQSDLAHDAAALHGRWLRGELSPELISNSDVDVDRYLKGRVPFRVHCPPRTDVDFAVQGAGVCSAEGRPQAAYIVGRVERSPVSILVLDRISLAVFPHDRSRLQGGRRHRVQEGDYRLVSGVVADNVVVVVGAVSEEALERLLNAYGTYHDG
jgi:anti-sigma factor RsiW